MASTYSDLKIQLMATGENAGTWGDITNTNLGTAIEEALAGTADVTFDSADITLSLTNTNTTQTARHLRLNLVGTTGGARELIVPDVEKSYIINNTCADDVTVKTAAGTGTVVPASKSMMVYNDGTNVSAVINSVPGGTETADRWTTARTVTIGDTGKSVDGSANVSWNLTEIGAQATLVSGTNIKTINGDSILGSGNLEISGGGGSGTVTTVTATLPLSSDGDTVSPNISLTGVIDVSNGGTGTNFLTSGRYLKGNGSSAISQQDGVPGSDITGTISGSSVSITNLSASNITSGTLSENRIADGSIGADKLKTGTISSGVELRIDDGSTTYAGTTAGAAFRSTSQKFPVIGINTGNNPAGGFANVSAESASTPAFSVGAAFDTSFATFRTAVNMASYVSAIVTSGNVTVFGDIVATGTITPFTGSHLGLIATAPDVGDIVVDTGNTQNLDISNSVSTLAQSSTAEMKSVVGVFVGLTEPPEVIKNTAAVDIFADVVKDGKSYCMINSLGEGLINVVGENGNIEVGDLIVTSSTAGKGMKQTDDVVRSKTVAKARETVTFSSPSEVKQIACIYMCG